MAKYIPICNVNAYKVPLETKDLKWNYSALLFLMKSICFKIFLLVVLSTFCGVVTKPRK